MTLSPLAASKNPWRRLLAMIGFGVIGYLVFLLLLLLAVVQFVFRLRSADPRQRFDDLALRTMAYLDEILALLLYETNKLPYPFRPLPGPRARENGAPTHEEAS